MFEADSRRHERAAALLERAYRMALVLKASALCDHDDALPDCAAGFQQIAVSAELVELLDEARSALLEPACGEQRRNA